MKKLFNFIFRFYGFIKDNVSKSIRLELVVTFAICLISAFIAGSWYNGHYKEQHMIAQIDYSNGIQELSSKLSEIKSELENLNTLNKNYINQKIDESLSKKDGTVKIYLADMDGNVICKSKSAYQKKLDIYSLVNKAEDFRKEYDKSIVIDTDNGILKKRVVLDKVQEYVEIDGLNISNRKLYLIIMGVPEQKTTYIRSNGSIFSVIEAIVVFIGLFYFMTIKKMGYIEIVSRGLVEISKNNLDYRIKIYGKDELAKLANNINFMASELKKRVEGERAAEKTKNDLITNVSHDLRTPLTSIKGYLGLIKDKKYKDEVQMGEFLDIAYAKSEKLEILINDLFEYTKLSNKVIEIHRKKIYIDELLEQLSEELHVICEENNVKLHKNFHGSRIYAYVDPDKIVRVFENLIMNAIRYSLKPGGINLELKDNGKCILISVENRCDHIDESDLKKLFNRFFRVDKSRSEATGGSGLGLAIAKSIVELHDGKIWAESIEDRVIFYVELKKDIQS
ncbi:sensor histidine kinase [Clostridium fermenticellae]|uniref:histidine kinase n=1 Tax=Clostridium fermenticellae TaxID=2068654 RepID=A0A386H1B8_9CLOT|nr:HAMP domain-containing sensor histidine kinase [Clostridium fermenticellae]AYD39464.1 sensor histidine kinase [Clostridium fermenticellae]